MKTCPICDKELPDDSKLVARTGYLQWLNPENQYVHKHNTPFITEEERVCGIEVNGKKCEKVIGAGWKVHSGDGYVTWHNTKMVIAHRHNFTQDFQKGKREKKPKKENKKQQEGDVEKAFVAYLENPESEGKAQEARTQLMRSLAKVIERGDSSSVRAAEMAGQIVGEIFKAAKPPEPGEKCRLCGRLDKAPVILISKEMAGSEWQD